MKQILRGMALLSFFAAAALVAQPPRSVAEVVREDARTISAGDGAALLALFDEDSRIYGTPEHPDRLDGPLAKTMGTHAERVASFPRIAEGGPIRLEVAEMIVAGDTAVSKNILTAPNGRVAFNLVVYRVRDGIIGDLWHPARKPALDPAKGAGTREAVDRLVAAVNRGDAGAVRGLVHPDARLFASSGAAHAIGDRPLIGTSRASGVDVRRLFGADAARVALAESIVFDEYLASRYLAALSDGREREGIAIFRIVDGRLAQAWRIQESAPRRASGTSP